MRQGNMSITNKKGITTIKSVLDGGRRMDAAFKATINPKNGRPFQAKADVYCFASYDGFVTQDSKLEFSGPECMELAFVLLKSARVLGIEANSETMQLIQSILID